jgi:hypothetical protein
MSGDLNNEDMNNLQDKEYPQMSWHIRLLVLLSISLLLCISYIIIKSPSAQGYEISIYEWYPWYFWWIIILLILISQIFLFGTFFDIEIDRPIRYYGFILFLITDSFLLFLPVIRGYWTWGVGDVLTHIGYMQDILLTGYIGRNTYPIDHLIGMVMFFISGIYLNEIVMIVPPIFSILFIIFTILLFKSIFKDINGTLYGLIFSCILLWGNANISFSPNAQAIMVVPLVFYLFLKRYTKPYDSRFALLTIIIIFFVTFFHPLVILILALCFLIFDASFFIYSKFYQTETVPNWKNSFIIIMIIAATFFTWQAYVNILIGSIRRIYFWLIGEALQSNYSYYSSIAEEAQIPIYNQISIILNIFGIYVIIACVSFLCIVLLLKDQRFGITTNSFERIFSSIGFLIFFILTVLVFISGIGFGFGRIYNFATIFFLILIPSFLIYRSNSSDKRMISPSTALILTSIVLLVYLSTFSLFSSPFTKASGQHVTEADINGMNHFFEARNESINILENGPSSLRFFHAFFGTRFSSHTLLLPGTPEYLAKDSIPDHFLCDNKMILGECYDSPRYLNIGIGSRIFYRKVLPEYKDKWRYNDTDYAHLENDRSVVKIYANGGLDEYYIE